MGKQRFKGMEDSAELNNQTYSDWFSRLYNIAISVYEWVDLPETIDERFLEMTLFWQGQAVFFDEQPIGYLALPSLAVGPLDVYAKPTLRTAYSYNGFQRQGLDKSNSVLIYNNFARSTDAGPIRRFAKRLYNIERAMDVNVNAQKTPILLIAPDDKQKLTMLNAYKEYDGNSMLVCASKGFDANNFNVLKTDAPFVSDKLQILKRQVFQEALTFLGVEANTSEKAERQVSGEITTNLGGTEASRLTRLNARKQACTQINQLFGLNIDVRFRSSLNLSKIMDDEPIEGGEPVE